MIDAGDLVFDCGDAEDLTQRLEAAADAILNSGKTLLGLGGDHFITLHRPNGLFCRKNPWPAVACMHMAVQSMLKPKQPYSPVHVNP